MYCRKCGVKIEDDSVFCYKCGERVVMIGAAAPPRPEPVFAPEPKAASAPVTEPAPIFEPEPVSFVQNDTARYVSHIPNNITSAHVSSIPVYNTAPAPCERTCSPVSDYINMDRSAAQARWSEPEIDKPMKWYKFLVYFGLWVGVVSNFSEAVYGLFGIAKNDAEQYLYYFISGYEEYDRIAAVFLLGIVAFQIYTCIQLLGFRKKAPILLVVLCFVVLVYNLITIFVADLLMSVSLGYLVGNIIGVFIFCGLLCALNAVYFYKRRHLFVY